MSCSHDLGGVFHTCRAAARGMMRRRSGAIVNLTSVVGLHGNPGQTNYAASKAGIIGFTKALARELATRNVRANAVAPGYITTALTEVLPEQAQQAILSNTPLQRMGTPEDVAAAVRYLCSEEASFVTGEVCSSTAAWECSGRSRAHERPPAGRDHGMGAVSPLGLGRRDDVGQPHRRCGPGQGRSPNSTPRSYGDVCL